VQRWADRITEAYGESVDAIIEVGRQLVRAKAECSHGEWGELTGETTGKPLLPFSPRTAQMFKSIAENSALSNPHHGADLPVSWRTLSVLASLEPEDIEFAIEHGAIHQDMNRKDAIELKKQLQPPKPAPAAAPVLEFPVSEQEQAALNDGLAEGGQMIAEFAERQAERAQTKAELAQQPAHQDAAATYRAILGHLQAADAALATANELAYFDTEFWDAAMKHAKRIVISLEKLPCK
jgi:hypothetical protein